MAHRASPYVRRLRIAERLKELYAEYAADADGRVNWGKFADFLGVERSKLSRYVNIIQKPALADMMQISKALGFNAAANDVWMQMGFEANQKGWWDPLGDDMGARQKLFADLEYGAVKIREFANAGFPGVAQTVEYTQAVIDFDREESLTLEYKPGPAVEARGQRQREMFRSGGPDYEVLLDEIVIRRPTVAEDIFAGQLRHMVNLCHQHPQLTVRVLPIDVPLLHRHMVKSPLYLYRFGDPEDPALAIVDTVTSDLLIKDPEDVARYTRRYDRLREAALSPDASLDLLNQAADRLSPSRG